jgi:hypothetical protein
VKNKEDGLNLNPVQYYVDCVQNEQATVADTVPFPYEKYAVQFRSNRDEYLSHYRPIKKQPKEDDDVGDFDDFGGVGEDDGDGGSGRGDDGAGGGDGKPKPDEKPETAERKGGDEK